MSRQEIYQCCNLIGGIEPKIIDGQGYWVVVEPQNATTESDRLFTERTFITGTAIAMKYGSRSEDVISEIESSTFAKAKARIDLQFYDHGKEYLQEITSKTLRSKVKPVDDEYIQRWLLIGLQNVRKKNPPAYMFHSIDVEGFCQILGINRKQYLYNASILLEEGFINEGETNGMSIESGGIHITSSVIREISSLIERKEQLEPIPQFPTEEYEDVKEEFQYDVAISCAGEDREIAEQLATELKRRDIRVFYDDFEKATLWGKNLYEHLDYVYRKAARYCIMLLSKHYGEKAWTNHERKSAQARAFRERNEYVLPIRIDNTQIPGLPETVGYISLKGTSIANIVDLIMKKLAALP